VEKTGTVTHEPFSEGFDGGQTGRTVASFPIAEGLPRTRRLLSRGMLSILALCPQKRKLNYSFRLYLNSGKKRVLGKGGAQILTAIDRLGSISEAAEELQMSYRFIWRYIRRTEERLGQRVIVTRRGGTPHRKVRGGGGAKLTQLAKSMLLDYKATEAKLQKDLKLTPPTY
jgi:molybdate transport system regulatory protein